MIDPDAIGRSMSSGNASREALRRRKHALGEKRSYLIETTLSGAGILRHMEVARSEGYRIVLHYVALSSPEHALDRIRNRVALGGHDVPEIDVRRRFLRSNSNLAIAAKLADEIVVYDNSKSERPHSMIAIFLGKANRVSDNVPVWAGPIIESIVASRAE